MLNMNYLMFALAALLEVYLEPGERGQRISPSAESALSYLCTLAARIPVARASLERFLGRMEFQRGHVARGVYYMKRSLKHAVDMQLGREEALARSFLGRFAMSRTGRLFLAVPARVYLESALSLFMRLGVHAEAARVRQVIMELESR